MKKATISDLARTYKLNKSKILKVSDVNEYISKKLKDPYLTNLFVLGEISNLTMHPSGNIYFDIKDEGSILHCAFFKSSNWSLTFKLKEGLQILANGTVKIYEQRSQYQLIISKVIPIGKGLLHAKAEELKAKLREEGLFDLKHKKQIPAMPSHIGVITARKSAACKDLIKVISKRFPVDLSLVSTDVQGDRAAKEIISAIKLLNKIEEVDLIVIARGGGSSEDLMCFNDENLARAIFKSKKPVLTGIGHQTDVTIVDFVADSRAATPSVAAEMSVPNKRELLERINELESKLKKSWKNFQRNISGAKKIKRYKRTIITMIIIFSIVIAVLMIWLM